MYCKPRKKTQKKFKNNEISHICLLFKQYTLDVIEKTMRSAVWIHVQLHFILALKITNVVNRQLVICIAYRSYWIVDSFFSNVVGV